MLTGEDDYDFSSSDSEETTRNMRLGQRQHSSSSTASATPAQSRSPSPRHYISDPDTEPTSPFLRNRPAWWRGEDRRRWWLNYGHRRRSRDGRILRVLKKFGRQLVRHPFFPRQPVSVLLTLILFSAFAIFVTLLLMYILNPDKEPLPWRAYCAVPSLSAPPEPPNFYHQIRSTHPSHHPFPPDNLESLPPVGIFIGVTSVDSAFERRALVRTTWAYHPRSRNGAGDGDQGNGTSRTIVRFILGQPRKDWEHRIRLEMERYNDIIILPISENMNSGKTYELYAWAAANAWVPPLYFNTTVPAPVFSYSNQNAAPPPLATHDPPLAFQNPTVPWVRPDYVIKMDDDAFVMLAELETRLRVELHSAPTNATATRRANMDPMIYWGYLVTNRLHRFMAGELYALTWTLVEWLVQESAVKTLTRGAEDKLVAKWMRLHPQASEVRWTSERCWIYDHPRAATVYSHGFLFPSEVTRVKQDLLYPDVSDNPFGIQANGGVPTPTAWAYSSVTTFGVRYVQPLPGLTPLQSVEALVEGSNMSLIREDSDPMSPTFAWDQREGRKKKYEGRRVGGTVVIHFIKKNAWFLETALAMLDGEEVTHLESQLS